MAKKVEAVSAQPVSNYRNGPVTSAWGQKNAEAATRPATVLCAAVNVPVQPAGGRANARNAGAPVRKVKCQKDLVFRAAQTRLIKIARSVKVLANVQDVKVQELALIVEAQMYALIVMVQNPAGSAVELAGN